MAGKILLTTWVRQCARMQAAGMSSHVSKIGARDIVGDGMNGDVTYVDHVSFPMPAIRYKESTPDVQALREKEKGDWKKLSVEEKKALYRASFCQTFVEMEAPTGEWKSVIGSTFLFVSAALWFYMYLKWAVYPELPVTFDEEHQLAQLERIKLLDMNPVTGISSRK